jgi:hypothetical protein
MKKIEIDCFEVVSEFDRDITHVGYFATQELADQHVAKSPNYRRVRPFTKTFLIIEAEGELERASKEKAKEAALKKLSAQDIEILREMGLD